MKKEVQRKIDDFIVPSVSSQYMIDFLMENVFQYKAKSYDVVLPNIKYAKKQVKRLRRSKVNDEPQDSLQSKLDNFIDEEGVGALVVDMAVSDSDDSFYNIISFYQESLESYSPFETVNAQMSSNVYTDSQKSLRFGFQSDVSTFKRANEALGVVDLSEYQSITDRFSGGSSK